LNLREGPEDVYITMKESIAKKYALDIDSPDEDYLNKVISIEQNYEIMFAEVIYHEEQYPINLEILYINGFINE
jgi:hypothetical protein